VLIGKHLAFGVEDRARSYSMYDVIGIIVSFSRGLSIAVRVAGRTPRCAFPILAARGFRSAALLFRDLL